MQNAPVGQHQTRTTKNNNRVGTLNAMAIDVFNTDKYDANYHSQGSSLAATHKPPSFGTSDLNPAPKAASSMLLFTNEVHELVNLPQKGHSEFFVNLEKATQTAILRSSKTVPIPSLVFSSKTGRWIPTDNTSDSDVPACDSTAEKLVDRNVFINSNTLTVLSPITSSDEILGPNKRKLIG